MARTNAAGLISQTEDFEVRFEQAEKRFFLRVVVQTEKLLSSQFVMKIVLVPRIRGIVILATIKWRLPMLQIRSVRAMILKQKKQLFSYFPAEAGLFYSFLTSFIGYYRYVVKFHWLVSFATCRFDWLQAPGNRKGKLTQFWSCNSKIKQYKYRLLRTRQS